MRAAIMMCCIIGLKIWKGRGRKNEGFDRNKLFCTTTHIIFYLWKCVLLKFSRLFFFPHSKLVYVLISIFFITILLCVTITTNVLVISVVVRQCYLLHIIIIIIRVYYSYLLISNNYTFIKPTILNSKYFISSVARQGHNIRTATTTNCVKLSMCSCQGFCPYRRGMPMPSRRTGRIRTQRASWFLPTIKNYPNDNNTPCGMLEG